MKILVCIKQVPATNAVEIDEATGVLKRAGTAAKINPYDLCALELAFSLREAHGGTVAVLTMGPPQAEAALTETLRMGADSGILLTDRRFGGADVVATSRTLAAGVRTTGPYDLIVCGKQTTDGDTAQVGPELAECLGIPHACYVHQLRVEQGAAVAEVNLGDWMMTQQLPLPCLVTVEKEVSAPQLARYRRSGAVPDGAIVSLGLDDFGGADEKAFGLSGSPTQVERIFAPDKNTGRTLHTGTAAELATTAFGILADGKFI